MKKILFIFLFCPYLLFAESKIVEKEIRFTASHQFKKVNGKIDELKISTVQIKKSGESYAVDPFTISLLLKDMKTGDSNRDNHMIEALGFPEQTEITLDILKVQMIEGKYKIFFKVKINGVTKDLSIFAEVKESEGKIIVSGKFSVQLDQFNITPPSLLFIKVNNDVVCDFRFVLIQ
jgi:polyisoprenoid-binding protein YceI